MKNTTSWTDIDSFSVSTDSVEFKNPNTEKLTMEEERIYTILFGVTPKSDGIKVNEKMKECMTRFEAMGLAKDPAYPKLIELGKEAIDHNFDSVEKDRLHVINEDGSSEVICRHKTKGTWEFVAVIEKDLIEKAFDNKNSLLGSPLSFRSSSGQSLTISSKDFSISQP